MNDPKVCADYVGSLRQLGSYFLRLRERILAAKDKYVFNGMATRIGATKDIIFASGTPNEGTTTAEMQATYTSLVELVTHADDAGVNATKNFMQTEV